MTAAQAARRGARAGRAGVAKPPLVCRFRGGQLQALDDWCAWQLRVRLPAGAAAAVTQCVSNRPPPNCRPHTHGLPACEQRGRGLQGGQAVREGRGRGWLSLPPCRWLSLPPCRRGKPPVLSSAWSSRQRFQHRSIAFTSRDLGSGLTATPAMATAASAQARSDLHIVSGVPSGV